MQALKLCQWRTSKNMFYKRVNWSKLNEKQILNEHVILSKYGDIHSCSNGPVFFCKTLILDDCDRNFVAYWLNKRTFPKVQNIYVGSHIRPINFFLKEFSDIKLKESTQEYENQIHSNKSLNNNIKLISSIEYDSILEKYDRISQRMTLE